MMIKASSSLWVTCILLLTMLYSTAQTPHTMLLQKEQANGINELYQLFKKLQVACKQEGKKIKQLGSPQEYQQAKEANALIKRHYPAAKAVLANNCNTTSSEDIDPTSFVSAVTKWHVATEEFFEKCKTDYAQAVIDMTIFRQKMSKHQATLPLIAALYKEWNDTLKTLADSTTGQELFTALLTQSGKAWKLTGNVQALEQHYKKNKKGYKKYVISMEAFRDEEMPKQQYFLDALQASVSKEDPNLPENLAQQEQEQAEEQKYDFRRWENKYEDWLNTTVAKLEKVDSTEDGAIMDLNLLVKNKASALDAPSYAKEFWAAIGDKALQTIQAIGEEVSYLQARDAVKEALISHYNKTVDDDFLRVAVESGEDLMPHGLKSWLKNSTNKRKGLQGEFAQAYLNWTKDIAKVVAVCENQNKGRTFTVNVSQLEKELAERFNYTVNGVEPGEQLLPLLQQALPTTKTTDFSTLLNHWKEGTTALQAQDLIDILWEQYLAREAGQLSMKQAMDNFMSKLPSQESLVNALLDARYYKAKAPIRKIRDYGSSETIVAQVEVGWRPVPVLMGAAAEQIMVELGMETAANMISKAVGGGEVVVDAEGNTFFARFARSFTFDIVLPMQLVAAQEGTGVYAVPSSLEADSVKLAGDLDTYYNIEVKRVYTLTKQPREISPNVYRQELVIATHVIDPAMSVAVSASAIVGTEITMNKNPRTVSVDFRMAIESRYDEATNTYSITFLPNTVEIEDRGAIIQNVNADTVRDLELKVHE